MNNELSRYQRITAVICGIIYVPVVGGIFVTLLNMIGVPSGVLTGYICVYSFCVFMAHDRIFNDYKFTNSADTAFKRRFRKALSGYSVFAVIMLSLKLAITFAIR